MKRVRQGNAGSVSEDVGFRAKRLASGKVVSGEVRIGMSGNDGFFSFVIAKTKEEGHEGKEEKVFEKIKVELRHRNGKGEGGRKRKEERGK
jgi:hypothetical protein